MTTTTKMGKRILDLSNAEAKDYFLCGNQYVGIGLPSYFVRQRFGELLTEISNYLVKHGGLKAAMSSGKPHDYDTVNHTILHSKDGRFAWRRLELQHPAIYAELVNEITKLDNWSLVLRRLNRYRKTDLIDVQSDFIPDDFCAEPKEITESHILSWWSNYEQRSIELSLYYNTLLRTDIFDCYGQIYTHSLAWSLHGYRYAKRSIAKGKKSYIDKQLGGIIDNWLQGMRYRQTNGIPQGSALMDFIADIVLSYADYLLSKSLSLQNKHLVKILRYRDDYRIFSPTEKDAELVLKSFSEVLACLGLKHNENKTHLYSDVIHGSIKPDKLDWLMTPREYESFFHLLHAIYAFSMNHPNSGTLLRALKMLREKFEEHINNNDAKQIYERKDVVLAFLIDIAYHSPRTIPSIVGIISVLLEKESQATVENVIYAIRNKFANRPSSGFLEIWLQRLALPHNIEFDCETELCKIVFLANSGKPETISLWNSEWISSKKLRSIIDSFTPFDKCEVKKAISTPIIPKDEVHLFIDADWNY